MRTIHRIIIAASLLISTIAAAQSISFGVRGYAETKDALLPTVPLDMSGFHQSLNRYTVGPTVEVALPQGFAIQFDALRSPLEFREESFTVSNSNFLIEDFKDDTVGHSWQFPLTAKYYVRTRTIVRPYANIGFPLTTVSAFCPPQKLNTARF